MYKHTNKMKEASDLINEIQEKVDSTLDTLSSFEPITGGREGSLCIQMPSFNNKRYEVTFYSKVLVPDVFESWEDTSLVSALNKAKEEIFNWCELELEMPSFHRHFLLDSEV